jgi:hypothetical protein
LKEKTMEVRSRFIAPERMGVWIVVAFGTAILALVLAFWTSREARVGALVTQTEVINLNQRLQSLEKAASNPAPSAPAAAAPAPTK